MRLEPADVCGALADINPWWDPTNEWAECSPRPRPIECFGAKGYEVVTGPVLGAGRDYRCGSRYGGMSSAPWYRKSGDPAPLSIRGNSGRLFWWLRLDGVEADFGDRARTADRILRAWFSHRMIPPGAEVDTACSEQEPGKDNSPFLPGGVSCECVRGG